CECQPLTLTLINAGMFPSSPVQPCSAFDLNHLLWASTVFLYGVPNISAWSGALTAYLMQKGFDVPSEDALRRLFGTALVYFQQVQQQAAGLTHNIVQEAQ
ncbi:hypothetical protein BS47DRAFT_1260512, partial [Hydnum rufescens UP504]